MKTTYKTLLAVLSMMAIMIFGVLWAYAQEDPVQIGQTTDDAIGFGFQQFLMIFDWGYIFSLIFLVALLYKFLLGQLQVFNRIDRIYVVIVIGVVLGWVWMSVGETTWPKMIVSFPFAVLLHKALLTKILEFLKLEDKG